MHINMCMHVYTHTHHTTATLIMYINLECLGIHNSNVIFFLIILRRYSFLMLRT